MSEWEAGRELLGPPTQCGAQHPKYKGVSCVRVGFRGEQCWDFHQGIIGQIPRRRWVRWEAATEKAAGEVKP